jgi:hypothetical protein
VVRRKDDFRKDRKTESGEKVQNSKGVGLGFSFSSITATTVRVGVLGWSWPERSTGHGLVASNYERRVIWVKLVNE